MGGTPQCWLPWLARREAITRYADGQQSCLGLEALPKINCRRPPVAAGAA